MITTLMTANETPSRLERENFMNKRLAGTGLAIGLVAGAGAGLILEMAGSAGASSGSVSAQQAVVDDSTADSTAPADTPAPPDSAKPDPSVRLQKILQPLIDDGTITQAQADKIIAALAAARPAGPKDGEHRVLGGPGQFGLDVVATALGITTDEVRTALQSGQSLADLAVSKGKTAQDVIDAIVTEATTKINDKVTAGDLTQAQADKILSGLTTLATDFVNNARPFAGPIFGGRDIGPGRGFGGPRHRGNDNDDGDEAPANAPTDATVTTVAG
jgi:hypothetical protein